MKLCILVADVTLPGGGERMAINIANYFVSAFDYEVHIVSIHKNITELPYVHDERTLLTSLHVDLAKKGILVKSLERMRSWRAIRKFLSKNKFNYVLGIGTYPNVLLALAGPGLARRFGSEQIAFEVCPAIWKLMRRFAYPKLDGVVTLTNRDLEKIRRINANAACIANCRSFFPDRPADVNCKQLLSIGRLEYQKGFDILIDVFQELHSVRPDWILKIIGQGSAKQELYQRIDDYQLWGSVQLIDRAESIIDEYLTSSIFIMTSRWEGMPLVLLEAQACGLPIVSFDCPTGPREIIQDGIDGFLVKPNDLQDMVSKTLQLIGDGTLRARFSKSARLHSDRFSQQAICNQWKQFLESDY